MYYYFSFDELTTTETGISNSIPVSEMNPILHNLMQLRTVLNVLRGLVDCPITVTSAYRNCAVNAAVGGSLTSNHLFGRAADVTCPELHTLLEYTLKLHDAGVLSEVIYYPDKRIIHIAI